MSASGVRVDLSVEMRLRLGMAVAVSLVALWSAAPGRAQEPASGPWTPHPYVAEDTGNWSSTTFDELQIRLDGFTGYETEYWLTSDIIGLKLYHPQHVVRLPNAKGSDGKIHAYFAITQSHAFTSLIPGFLDIPDGYWMIAEIDADAYDPATDRIKNTPGSDGRYVYEEHFTGEIDHRVWQGEYTDRIKKGSQFVLSTAGDWIHPCKMSAFGGLLVMVGQNWDPKKGAGTKGKANDAVLFYDVRDPVHPKYLGLLDTDQMQTSAKDQGRLKIDTMGPAYFPPTAGRAERLLPSRRHGQKFHLRRD